MSFVIIISLFQTKTVDQSLNPVWNTYGEFCIQSNCNDTNCNLTINVWDADVVGSDDYLGEAAVPLNDLRYISRW